MTTSATSLGSKPPRSRRARPLPHRPGHGPRPRFADACAVLAGLGLGVVLALVIVQEKPGSLAAPGGWLTAAGRLSGFLGGYVLLVLVVLMARIPWLERSVGQDQLVRWHRRLGPWASGSSPPTSSSSCSATPSSTPREPCTSYGFHHQLPRHAGRGWSPSACWSWSAPSRSASPAGASSTRHGGCVTSTRTWRWRWPSPTRSSPAWPSSATR